jgi:hypothetical protein
VKVENVEERPLEALLGFFRRRKVAIGAGYRSIASISSVSGTSWPMKALFALVQAILSASTRSSPFLESWMRRAAE